MHLMGSRARLDVHVDFNQDKARGLHRRLNILVFLNPDWRSEGNGRFELWDADVKQSSNGSPRSNLPSTAVSCSLPGMRVSMVSRRCAALPTSRDARSPRTTTPDPAPDRGPREACPSWRTGRSCIPVRKRALQ